MNPAVCVTGVVPSAPLVTVHVVPLMLVTAIISLLAEMSATWHCVGGVPVLETAGNDEEDATVHVSWRA